MLQLRLLGPFAVSLNRRALEWRDTAPAASAMLAMIALNNGRVTCDRVIAGLWPHLSGPRAALQLSSTLHTLRRDHPLLAEHLVKNQVALAWSAEASIRVDVNPFYAAVLRHDWSAAVATYTGDFLEGNGLEWAVSMREGLRLEYIYALDRLIEHCDLQQDFSQARLLSARLIELEPARESGYQLAMRYSHLLGDFMGVTATFYCCQRALRECFKEPSAATYSLYRACRTPLLHARGTTPISGYGMRPVPGPARTRVSYSTIDADCG